MDAPVGLDDGLGVDLLEVYMSCQFCHLEDCPGDCEQGKASYVEHEERQMSAVPLLAPKTEEIKDCPKCAETRKKEAMFREDVVNYYSNKIKVANKLFSELREDLAEAAAINGLSIGEAKLMAEKIEIYLERQDMKKRRGLV